MLMVELMEHLNYSEEQEDVVALQLIIQNLLKKKEK
jgi:hypothetical protein